LDELEAVELKLGKVYEDNVTFRFDSEFFKKEYLGIDRTIEQNHTIKLDNLSNWITQGANPKFSEGNIPSLTGRNINSEKVNYENADIIDEKEYKNLIRFQLQLNDILITLKGKGAIGKVSYVTENRKAIFSRNIGLIRVKKEKISPLYVYLFLISKFGVKLIEKGETGGTGQSTLTTTYLKHISMPMVSNSFQLKLNNLTKLAHKNQSKSKALYQEAETILLKELDLLDFKPTQENIAIKSFAESFLATGRLDSEYYQPKYDEIIEKIKAYKGGVDTIEKLCTLKDSNHKPIKDKFYQYIELSNIGVTGDITGCTYNQGQSLPSRARRLINSNDVIISSIEGSLEKIALVKEEFDNSLCSTGFYVVRSSKINASTLLVLFKNKMMQQILKQNCSGTILTAMNKDEFLNIAIPLIDIGIQKEIETKIKTSFQLKSKSKNLLELAKKAVEMAIEEGENRALEFIGENYE